MSKITSLQIGQKKVGLVLRASSKEGDYTDLINNQTVYVQPHDKVFSYTVPHDGVLYCRLALNSDSSGLARIFVSDLLIFTQNISSNQDYETYVVTYNVKKNEIIKFDVTGGGTGYMRLLDLKIYHYEED